jgi:hypothetical protein
MEYIQWPRSYDEPNKQGAPAGCIHLSHDKISVLGLHLRLDILSLTNIRLNDIKIICFILCSSVLLFSPFFIFPFIPFVQGRESAVGRATDY